LWIDCMNGDSRETGKLTPEGKPDPSVFSTEYNREGIRVGTAIGLLVRKTPHRANASIRYREFWGTAKRTELVQSLNAANLNDSYQKASPAVVNRYSFRPQRVSAEYYQWPRVTELAAKHFNGPVERKAFALISLDPDALRYRMKKYFDPTVNDSGIRDIFPSLMTTGRNNA
jgi:hypothetical protein